MPTSSPIFFPRTIKHWMWTAIVILTIALFAKIIISVLTDGYPVEKKLDWIQGYGISVLYTTIIVMIQLSTAKLINQLVPLRKKVDAAIHIVVQSFSAAIAFWIAMNAEFFILGDCTFPAHFFGIVAGVSFGFALIGNSVFYIARFYVQMKQAERNAIESELKALRAQINPHFLFNTLNSIASLIRSHPEIAENVTEELADLFRYSLRASKHPLVTLSDELESVRLYLGIEQVRFGERLVSTVDIPTSLHDASVPSLLLQPLIENAIKHGANKLEGEFFIHLSAFEKDGIIELIVHDSGNGFDLNLGESIFHKGTGLQNVRERLLLLFPNRSKMKIEKHAVILVFPYEKLERQIAKDSIYQKVVISTNEK